MLRIMTLNINSYGIKYGPWPGRRSLIGSIIRATSPTVVALQAVSQDPAQEEGIDQAAQLARELNSAYPYVLFQPAMTHPDERVDGLALLSRLPFAGTESRPLSLLPGLDDANQRVLLKARFDLADGPFFLLNGHFSWVPEQNSANVEEALLVLKTCSGPALLVGDLNATPDLEGMEQLRRAGWMDAWAALHPQTDGFTFEADQPRLRIDYAWLNPALKPRLQAIDVIAGQPDESGNRVSDHLGLLVDLDLDT